MTPRRVFARLAIPALILLTLYVGIFLLIPDLLWGDRVTLQIPGDEQHFQHCLAEAVDVVPQVQLHASSSLSSPLIDLVPSPASGLKFGLYRVTRETSGEVRIDALGPANLNIFFWRAWKMKTALAALTDAVSEKCGRNGEAAPATPGR